MRDYPVDILNAHWSYEFAYAALEAGLPSLVTLHDHALTVLRYARDPYRFVRLLMNYSVLSKAQYLSANSPYLYSRLSERNKKKTRTIPNFYTEFLEQCSARPVAKSSFVLSVSNGFSRFKNIGTALKAFSIIRKRKPDIEYHLIGDNMEVGGLAYEYAVRNRVTDGVQFLGRLEFEEVTRKIRQALVLLHPSREESFGSILLEAMVLGTPVVGGHSSGNVPYLLDNGRAGVLSDVNSAQETAKAVLTVLEDVELARSLVERAKRFAEKNFSEDVILQAYTTYYHDIVDRSSRPGMA
jgi:glycosyltransferase involved in cell wall biosynthesis